MVKNPPANAGDVRDTGSIPGSGKSPEGGHGNSLVILAWRIPWTEEPGSLVGYSSWGTQLSNLAAAEYLIYNIVLIFAYICKVTQLCIYILLHIPFPCGLSQDSDYSCLCFTTGPCLSSTHFSN